jgi:chromosome segregation ATPase
MKKFLENLLLVVALGLCGLCAYQWLREANLRTKMEDQSKVIFQKKEAIQNLEATLKRTEAEVERLDTLKIQLNETIKTNKQEILTLTKYSERLEKEIEAQKSQIQTFKDALDQANESIKKQNEDIKRQNEMMKDLAAERNAGIEKYNEVVKQYNDLAKQFEQYQQEAQKVIAQATNALANATKNPPAPRR